MPGGDRTGPMGMGPMTGRSAGFCAGYTVPGYMNPIPGRGGGMGFGQGRGGFGRGGGRGWRNMYYATGLTGWQRSGMGLPAWGGYAPAYRAAPYNPAVTPDQELNALKSQVQFMEEDLKAAKERVTELEKEAQEEK